MGETSIGGTLRAERLRQGRDLTLIAAETKLSQAILDALESDRFECLPGGAYKRSFLRQYASALGLDADDVVRAYLSEYGELPVPLPVPPRAPRSWHLGAAASLMMAAAALFGLYKFSESGTAQTVSVTHSDSRDREALTPPASPVQPSSSQASSPQTPSEPAASVAEEGTPAPSPLRVTFTATEPVWLSIRCDGTPAYTGTLAAQQARTFEATGAVTVVIGNAGGLLVSLNGHSLGSIGAHGETQVVEFTPSGARRLQRHPAVKTNRDSDPGI